MTLELYRLITDLEARIDKLEKRVKSLEEPKRAFTPPTIAEVSLYCKERKNAVNPSQFVDFYTAKIWMVGKTKMKDWRASVRTWEKSEVNEGTGRRESDEIPIDYGVPSETALTLAEYKARKNKL